MLFPPLKCVFPTKFHIFALLLVTLRAEENNVKLSCQSKFRVKVLSDCAKSRKTSIVFARFLRVFVCVLVFVVILVSV